jgi:hypothetical protein
MASDVFYLIKLGRRAAMRRPTVKKAIADATAADAASQRTLNSARTDLSDLQQNRNALRTALGTGSTPAEFSAASARTNASNEMVSTVVRDIVMAAFEKPFMSDFCQMYWAGTLKG